MDRATKAIIKQTIARVNKTLGYYEKDYISVQRSPWSNKERCLSFEQYVEARFNFEISKIPEFEYLCQVFEGKLFGLIDMTDCDEDRCRFKLVTFSLPPENVIKEVVSPFPELEPLINDEILKVTTYLGGKTIKFNNVKQKIKIIIEK